MKPKRATIGVILLIIGILSGCSLMNQPVDLPISPNQPPIIGCGGLHSPNGIEQHAPYEWDIYGAGYDPDGEIVTWIVRINGETFRVGNDPNRIERSEKITYQFPGEGWYLLSITAFDNDGASTTFTPPPDGLLHIYKGGI